MIIFQNRTTAIDTTPVTATEDTTYQIIVSGEPDGADIDVMVSTDGLRALPVKKIDGTGQITLTVKNGTSWYLSVTDVGPDTDLDASYL